VYFFAYIWGWGGFLVVGVGVSIFLPALLSLPSLYLFVSKSILEDAGGFLFLDQW
jgi:hypothetical protein